MLARLGDTMPAIAGHNGCGTSGCGGQAKCKSQTSQGDLPARIWDNVKAHPRYSEDADHNYAQMHVAVAPACNIQCNYCNRKCDRTCEPRPGVVSEPLSQEQAAKRAFEFASILPQLTVFGTACPGDALANSESTFKMFELIKKTSSGSAISVA